ncbi:hypothetical protein Hanom_Chr08g00705501 [Helianthus anomalus]
MRNGQGMHLAMILLMLCLGMLRLHLVKMQLLGERRFEGSGYVNVPYVMGFTKVPGSKVSVCRLNRHLKGVDQPSSSEAIDISNDIEVSAELVTKGGVEMGKKKELVGSSDKSVEGLEEPKVEEVYVPNWGVKVGDSFKDPAVCADVLAHFSPPGVRDAISEMEGDHFISKLMLSSCNLSALLVEGATCFTKGMQEYEEVTKKKDKMKASMVKKVRELTMRHEIEMNDLKKNFEANKLKLKADREALDVQKKAFDEEKEGLKALVA